MGTVLVFCPNLIGDTVMATPTFRALRQGRPGDRILAVVKPGVAATLAGGDWFDDLVLFDHKSKDRDRQMPAVVQRLRDERPELAVLLPNSFRSALVAWLAGAERRVGYGRGGRSLLLTERLSAPRDSAGRFLPVPIIGYYAELARRAGCRVDSLRPELFTTDADEAAADLAWAGLGLDAVPGVVCLNNGGAFGPSKNWPNPYFAEVATRLAQEQHVGVLVLCGPNERESAREIVALANHPRVVSLADQPMSIGLSKACVKRSRLMITTDSGPRHFAVAFRIPVVSLFGSTHIAWTRTDHPQAIHVAQPVPCGPCQQPVCPEGHMRCMTELKPEAVLRAALRLLHLPQSPRVTHESLLHAELA